MSDVAHATGTVERQNCSGFHFMYVLAFKDADFFSPGPVGPQGSGLCCKQPLLDVELRKQPGVAAFQFRVCILLGRRRCIRTEGVRKRC